LIAAVRGALTTALWWQSFIPAAAGSEAKAGYQGRLTGNSIGGSLRLPPYWPQDSLSQDFSAMSTEPKKTDPDFESSVTEMIVEELREMPSLWQGDEGSDNAWEMLVHLWPDDEPGMGVQHIVGICEKLVQTVRIMKHE
jgi:hypothetical protein